MTSGAAASSAVPPTASAALPTLEARLHYAQVVQQHIDFNKCDRWNCSYFVHQCILQKQHPDQKNGLFLGKDISSSLRGKLKLVFKAMERLAGDENM